MNESAQSGISVPGKERSPYLLWSIWVVWLPFAAPAFIGLFQSHLPMLRLLASLLAGVLFLAIYLWANLRTAQRLVASAKRTHAILWQDWLTVGVLTTLALALTVGDGPAWGGFFIYTAAFASGRLPIIQAAIVLIGLEVIILMGILIGHLDTSNAASGLTLVAIVGVVVMGVVHFIATDRELRLAREEIARLAVTTERLRIARDLHDLLGHNLSLITLKSELAGRLLQVAPERAAREIGDVEQVARTTLEEVRAAVANYRQPTLANELHAASEILAAAGIVYQYEGHEASTDTLPTPLEALLAWTVREGVTNVIRHSRAHQCTIRLTRTSQQLGIEILDDGKGSSNQASETSPAEIDNHGGNGLRGLKERVAELGGSYEIGPRASGGFELSVSVSLTPYKR